MGLCEIQAGSHDALEVARLQALEDLEVLPVQGRSAALQAIVASAAAVCDVPIALVTLLDESDQHFKAQIGLTGVAGTPREVSFCTHAIKTDQILEVRDAHLDRLFVDNPLVTGDPKIRFYAGAPMETSSGHRLGTVCVIDHRPRELTEVQRSILKSLANAVVAIFEDQSRFRQERRWVQGILDSMADCVISTDAVGEIDYVNPAAAAVLGVPAASVVGQPVESVLALRCAGEVTPNPVTQALATAQPASIPSGSFLEFEDSDPVEIEDSAAPILNKDGQVVGAVMIFRDVTEERETQRQLEYFGTRDPLTGVLNRYSFEKAVTDRLGEQPNGEAAAPRGAVLYGDLDRFKGVNDELGHAIGDQLLQQVANAMSARIKDVGLFARIGGDEFGVLLPPMPKSQVAQVAQDLLTSLAELRLSFADQRVNVGASFGMVMLDDSGLTLAETLRRADIACYAAKNEGGDQARWYDGAAGDIEAWTGSLRWMNTIEQALHSDGLGLFGQHISPLNPDHLPSIEVLVRLKNGDQHIAPGAFMPAVERFLLGRRLDEWVLSRTLAVLAAEPEMLDQVEAVHLNLCAQTLGDVNIVQRFVELIIQSGVDPSKLCFEITESGALADFSSALVFIDGLKAIGCQFALDDFGRGFSSFEYLKRLPVDLVKIDGMFIIDLTTDEVSQHMVAAIQGVCDLLGLRTVAECVETSGVLPHLTAIGLHSTQGFFHHRPEPLTLSFQALNS